MRRPRRHAGAVPSILTLALLIGSPLPCRADWISASSPGGLTAGYAEKKSFDIMWFACPQPGRLDLVFTGFSRGLPQDAPYTVVVSVDGTAYFQETRPRPVGAGRSMLLVRSAPPEAFAPLIAALKTGTKMEISTPAGRGTLALKGSGKALTALEAACR